MSKTFPVHYQLGHTYQETWEEQTGIHCPGCGEEDVWAESSGDMDLGPSHLCLTCGAQFYLPTGVEQSPRPGDLGRLEVLRGKAVEVQES